jgi:dihydrodipicolinate synthase/N-acetylneuraminate lyase
MHTILAVALVAIVAASASAADSSSSGYMDCAGLTASFVDAASKAEAETSAFVQLTVSAKAQAEAAAYAATTAAAEARALSSVSVDLNHCVTAEASGYGKAIASALANASSFASAVASASGKAFATATAAAVAEGHAQLAICKCPDKAQTIRDASASLAKSQAHLDDAVHAWDSARSARKSTVSAATAAASANSQTSLKFCSSCGKGYDYVNLTKNSTDKVTTYN